MSSEATENKTLVVYGPDPVPRAAEGNQPLAFLPNLMPTYKTAADGDDDGMHMFSLVHQIPHMDQGWQPMKRGSDMPMLLVDRTTLGILEQLGAVDWKPLPGGLTDGTAGIFCYTPDKNAAKTLRDSAAKETYATEDVAAKVKQSVLALEKLSISSSCPSSKTNDHQRNAETTLASTKEDM